MMKSLAKKDGMVKDDIKRMREQDQRYRDSKLDQHQHKTPYKRDHRKPQYIKEMDEDNE